MAAAVAVAVAVVGALASCRCGAVAGEAAFFLDALLEEAQEEAEDEKDRGGENEEVRGPRLERRGGEWGPGRPRRRASAAAASAAAAKPPRVEEKEEERREEVAAAEDEEEEAAVARALERSPPRRRPRIALEPPLRLPSRERARGVGESIEGKELSRINENLAAAQNLTASTFHFSLLFPNLSSPLPFLLSTFSHTKNGLRYHVFALRALLRVLLVGCGEARRRRRRPGAPLARRPLRQQRQRIQALARCPPRRGPRLGQQAGRRQGE